MITRNALNITPCLTRRRHSNRRTLKVLVRSSKKKRKVKLLRKFRSLVTQQRRLMSTEKNLVLLSPLIGQSGKRTLQISGRRLLLVDSTDLSSLLTRSFRKRPFPLKRYLYIRRHGPLLRNSPIGLRLPRIMVSIIMNKLATLIVEHCSSLELANSVLLHLIHIGLLNGHWILGKQSIRNYFDALCI